MSTPTAEEEEEQGGPTTTDGLDDEVEDAVVVVVVAISFLSSMGSCKREAGERERIGRVDTKMGRDNEVNPLASRKTVENQSVWKATHGSERSFYFSQRMLPSNCSYPRAKMKGIDKSLQPQLSSRSSEPYVLRTEFTTQFPFKQCLNRASHLQDRWKMPY